MRETRPEGLQGSEQTPILAASVRVPWLACCSPHLLHDHPAPTLAPALQVLVMEWIDGIRCTDVDAIKASGLDLQVGW